MRSLDCKAVVFVFSLLIAMVAVCRGDERLEFFEKRIRPVLAAHCYECHGPKKSESDLRVDHISFLKREGEYGRVLVPGEPLESGVFVSLTHANEDLMMPHERDKLAANVIADIKRWIEDGARWPDEPAPGGTAEKFDLAARKRRLPWIWQTPAKQTIPATRNRNWPRSDIDPSRAARSTRRPTTLLYAARWEPEHRIERERVQAEPRIGAFAHTEASPLLPIVRVQPVGVS